MLGASQKSTKMRLPNWILAESRTSALRHYSTQKRLALRRFSDKSPSHYVPLRPKNKSPWSGRSLVALSRYFADGLKAFQNEARADSICLSFDRRLA
jgi:hypothetical protein